MIFIESPSDCVIGIGILASISSSAEILWYARRNDKTGWEPSIEIIPYQYNVITGEFYISNDKAVFVKSI
jgi:hypothetical protein